MQRIDKEGGQGGGQGGWGGGSGLGLASIEGERTVYYLEYRRRQLHVARTEIPHLWCIVDDKRPVQLSLVEGVIK